MEVCKITRGCYQYTAVDDCTRYIVVGLFTRRTGPTRWHFWIRPPPKMPFPIQRIRTPRGREFFADKVQKRLTAWAIKFRPIKPRSPQLNRKVERPAPTPRTRRILVVGRAQSG
jgi:hypothetical protein